MATSGKLFLRSAQDSNRPMNITRVFLDWDRPCLPAAVEYLLRRFGSPGSLDLRNVVIAMPGSRAGRRLLEILVEQAEARGLAFSPPSIMTVGTLPERLYEAKRPFADDLTQQLAWIDVLRRGDRSRLDRLTPAAPAEEDLPAWLALGEMLARLHRELAADGLDFAAVAQCGSQIDAFGEQQRWELLAEIQGEYLRALDDFQLWDLQTARLFAIREAECRTDAEIVLVGTVDMNRSQRMMLDQVADRVTALIFAPGTLADRFDEHGCIRPEPWQDVAVDLATEQIEVVGGPGDQAAAAVRAIAALDGRYAAEQITVGVPDERLVPYLRQHLRQCEISARYGVGSPISLSGPYRLLAVVAEYLEHRRFSAFAALVRHPAVQTWLAGQEILGDWLSEMDQYHAEHLPLGLGDPWLGHPRHCETLEQVHRAIEQLLHKFSGGPRPLDRWGDPVVELLVDLFGGAALDTTIESDRRILAACEKIGKVLGGHAAIPEPLRPDLAGADALRLVLRQLDGETVAPLPDRDAVELLGWLELPLDDAPALIVTGFQEGIVPASLNADMFLPNQLRRALGIVDNDRRYARDAYALAVLVASRSDLKVIAGRRTAAADPLTPSRLLFACDPQTAAKRVRAFFSTGQAPTTGPILPGVLRPGQPQSRFEVPRPKRLAGPVASMSVTEFRDYLACPYRYYLGRQLKLARLDDAAEELDGAAFGSLAHDVLKEFGQSPAAASAGVDEIRDALSDVLRRIVHQRYGKAPLAAVRVQIEQLHRRLAAFAQWQAEWAADGWRIEHVETGPEPGTAALAVDGRPMVLRGRIDRIDFRESTGQRMIFDYKTSDGAKTPDQTHRTGGEWVDLQLPLYRHLVAGLGIAGPVELAYIVLPKDTGKVGHLPAQWTDEELRDADRVAEDVIRKVRAEEFWPPASPPPAFAEQFAAICQDDRFGTTVAAMAGQDAEQDAEQEGSQP